MGESKVDTIIQIKWLAEKIYCKVVSQIAEGKWFDVVEADQRNFRELAERYEKQVFKELKSYQKNRCYLNQLRDFFGKYKLSNRVIRFTPANYCKPLFFQLLCRI